jgi:thiopurine S-methyltransferase
MPDARFWLERWEQNETGWHQGEVNPRLVRHLTPRLAPPETVFVPLCGSSLDMQWLARQGCRVVGVELSELAAQRFFAEHDLACEVQDAGDLRRYRSAAVEILVGDYFALTGEALAGVTTVYDRGALVAIEPARQAAYVAHLRSLAPKARVLLVTVSYDGDMQGPPYSIDERDLPGWYGPDLRVERLEAQAFAEERFARRGGRNLVESVYWISPRES